jgi:UDP-N-acetylmuramoyl-L-alanyl-D-glutamate--2,6-diaminopimelate ligase
MPSELIYQLKRPYHFLKTGLLKGLPARIKYRFPDKKLKIIAITGTDGKTTSSTLLYHILKESGKKVALISTVGAYIGEEKIETGFHVTSPSPDQLFAFMKKMLDRQIEYLVLEFTSQGAYQSRLFGINPLIAGVTNIDQDHFDYHLNYQNYLEAKAIVLRKAKTVVLNEDDQSYYRLKKLFPSSEYNVLEYSQEQKLSSKIEKAIKERFPEAFNQNNSRLVGTIALELGLTAEEISQSLITFQGVPGRMQFIENKKDLKIVVDFAHTPQGLRSALTALRLIMKKDKVNGEVREGALGHKIPGNLIAVYGCAGLRDAIKRPMMGEIGVELADLLVFTAEDPRTEDIWSIIRQMKESLTTGHNKISSVPDRQEAINFAIQKLAKKGDLIAIFGKGPEKSMCYGTTEIEWSDEEAVKKALKS